MTQVSRRFLNRKVQERIFHLFISAIVRTNSKDDAIFLVEDLLTPTERIMFSKRFSIAYMLLAGYNYDAISDILKVSRTTIGKVSFWLQERGRGLRTIVRKIKADESLRQLLTEIQDSFEDILASTRGQNWSRSKKALYQRRKERKKAF